MSFRSRRFPARSDVVVGVALAVAAIALLSLLLRDGDVPAPTDGIGDIPAAHLVPDDAALYAGLATDLESNAWIVTFALLDQFGLGDLPGMVREGLAQGDGDWDEEIATFLGRAAALFVTGFDTEGGPAGAVIFHARDARAAEGVILNRRSDGFDERHYRDIPYKVMDDGGVLAVIGEHFVYAGGEAITHAIVDTYLGDTPALADADGFRRLRNALAGEALAFFYLSPGSLLRAVSAPSPGEDGEPSMLSIVGLDDLFTEPVGVVVRSRERALRLEAVMLGDPGPLVRLLRPRNSRFAEHVPAATAVFVSADDIAGVMDDFFGSSGLADLLRDTLAGMDGAETGGGESESASSMRAISLLDGELALALWTSNDGTRTETGLFAEVEDEERARELFEKLMGDTLSQGEARLSVEDGIAIIGSNAAIEFARSPSGPTLAGSERYSATVAQIDAPLATFAYIDIGRLIASGEGQWGEFGGFELAGDALALIVNLGWKDGRVHIEAALSLSAD